MKRMSYMGMAGLVSMSLALTGCADSGSKEMAARPAPAAQPTAQKPPRTMDARAEAPSSATPAQPAPAASNMSDKLPPNIAAAARQEVPDGTVVNVVSDSSFGGGITVYRIKMRAGGQTRDLEIRNDGVVLRNSRDLSGSAVITDLPPTVRTPAEETADPAVAIAAGR